MTSAGSFAIFALTILTLTTGAFAQSPREQFNAAIATFQKSATEDNARILALLAKQLDPPPAVSEDAEFRALKGAAFVKQAGDAAAFARAAGEFQVAIALAPWVGEYHFNLAVCEKSAGRFPAALAALKFAQIFSRDEQGRRDCLVLRAELEAAQELAAAKKAEEERIARSPEVLAAKKRAQDEALIKSLNGVRFDSPESPFMAGSSEMQAHWLVIKGDQLTAFDQVTRADRDLARANPRDHALGAITDWSGIKIVGTVARNERGVSYQITSDRVFLYVDEKLFRTYTRR